MYICPNCGDDLKFSIEEQKLCCASCRGRFDPGSKMYASRAEESELKVTVFTCPQCGAEMYSSGTDATAFCSYCGASNVLDSRLTGIRRPAKIIPFRKTKKDCQDAYAAVARRSIYAPPVFRDPEYLDNYRPIYMPYWLYNVEVRGKFSIVGKKEHREGDYIVTDRSILTCDVDSSFEDLPYDASSSFDDAIGQELAPFEMKDAREFSTTWLAGGYANVADVDGEVYQEEAVRFAAKEVAGKILEIHEFDGYDYSLDPDDENLASKLPLGKKTRSAAMLPVWFLSFRNEDRVAYAAVNGQTGKVSCELPVSYGRFFLFSLIMAVPIFFLLNMFLTLHPATELLIAAGAAIVMIQIYTLSAQEIRDRDARILDKGWLNRGSLAEREAEQKRQEEELKRGTADWAEEAEDARESGTRQKGKRKKAGRSWTPKKAKNKGAGALFTTACTIITALVLSVFICVFAWIQEWDFPFHAVFLFLLFVMTLVTCWGETDGKPELPAILLAVSVAAAVVIVVVNPVSDLIFYGASAAVLAVICYALGCFITQYNRLVTRPLPQFREKEPKGKRKDGDGDPGAKKEPKKRGSGKPRVKEQAMSCLILCALLMTAVLGVVRPVAGIAAGVPASAASGSPGTGSVFPEGTETMPGGTGGAAFLLQNQETGFYVSVEDAADLLTDEEEISLLTDLLPMTEYGNAAVATGYSDGVQSTYDFAADCYEALYGIGTKSGTMFMIDMENREIYIYNDGENLRNIDKGYAYVITDNVYRYASRGEYYQCVTEAYAQIRDLLEGRKIAQPMKYASNAFLALALAMILNYVILRLTGSAKTPSDQKILDSIVFTSSVAAPLAVFSGTTRTYSPPSRSSGGGGGGRSGGGGGGGGGGHSGGGGGHRF